MRFIDALKKGLGSMFGAAEKKESRKENYDKVNEICRNRLDNPKIIQGRNGKIAYGTDEGCGKPENEDALVVNTEQQAFASIDGMGGMEKGVVAAQAFAETIKKYFEQGADIGNEEQVQYIHEAAMNAMNNRGVKHGGVCYIAAKIEGRKMNVCQAGDVKLIIIDKNGILKSETIDQKNLNGTVSNAVQGVKPGRPTLMQFELEVGDRIIAASDGLWDNIDPQELAMLTKKMPIEQAIEFINNETKRRMQFGSKVRPTKPDNINVIIYDIENTDQPEATKTEVNKPKTESEKNPSLSNSIDFQDLYEKIYHLGGLQSSIGYIEAGNLVKMAENFRRYPFNPSTTLTSEKDFRQTVEKLAFKEWGDNFEKEACTSKSFDDLYKNIKARIYAPDKLGNWHDAENLVEIIKQIRSRQIIGSDFKRVWGDKLYRKLADLIKIDRLTMTRF